MNVSTAQIFESDHATWHAQVEAARTAPYGPLSPIAMHWLTAEPHSFDEAPGTWRVEPEGVVVAELSAADGVQALDGTPVIAAGSGPTEIRFAPLVGTESFVLQSGERRLELAARSGGVILRPRDPASADRLGYRGTATFAPSERWVIAARFVPAPATEVEVASAAGADRTQQYASPGSAEFEIDGQPVSLTLFGSRDDGDLRIAFADATGADLTFPASRFVDAEQIDDDTVVIDFNRTVNPPCAYSQSATCPFPPSGNRLAVRIEAGELRPGVAAPASADR